MTRGASARPSGRKPHLSGSGRAERLADGPLTQVAPQAPQWNVPTRLG
jgi:hypothetical protein